MAKQGNAGALCIAAIGSYIATIAVVGLMILGPFVADLALKFSARYQLYTSLRYGSMQFSWKFNG